MENNYPKSVSQMVQVLRAHEVPDWMYVIDAVSGDELYGIAQDDSGRWTTYYCERGKKNDVQIWSSEEMAVKELFGLVKEISQYQGYWKEAAAY
jgi:hypothetical protein